MNFIDVRKQNQLPCEAGFSFIELLTIVAVISTLAVMAMVAFNSYKETAELAKGDGTYRTGRTKLAISELDLPDGYSLAYTTSLTDGSMITGALGALLPDMTAGKNVRIGVSVAACNAMSNPMDLNQLIVVEPCRAMEKIQWTKLCGGIEVLTERAANPSPCT